MSLHSPSAGPTPWARVVAIALVLATAVSVIVLAFLWPAITSEVKGLPIAAAGPSAQLDQLIGGIDEHAPGAFDVTTVDDRDAADELVELGRRPGRGDRQALDLGCDGRPEERQHDDGDGGREHQGDRDDAGPGGGSGGRAVERHGIPSRFAKTNVRSL